MQLWEVTSYSATFDKLFTQISEMM